MIFLYMVFALFWLFYGFWRLIGAAFVFNEITVLIFALVVLNMLAYQLDNLRYVTEEAATQQIEQTDLLKEQNKLLRNQIALLQALDRETEEQSEDSDSTDEDE